MKIALLQMLILEKNKAANVDRGLRMLEDAAAAQYFPAQTDI